MSKLQSNLDAKSFISKKFVASHYSSINKDKIFIPKFFKKDSSKASNEKSNTKTYKKYFIIDEDDENTTYKFDFDYMLSFENWEICQETNILPEDLLKHLEKLKTVQLEPIQVNKDKKKKKKTKRQKKK